MDISCCPQCASLDIRQATVSDGVVAGAGELLLSVCRRCNYRGAPLYFDSPAEYDLFRNEVLSGEVHGEETADDVAPAAMQEFLALPAPGPPRGTAVFIGVLAIGLLCTGAFMLLTVVIGLIWGQFAFLPTAMGGLSFLLGLVFMRTSIKMWTKPVAGRID